MRPLKSNNPNEWDVERLRRKIVRMQRYRDAVERQFPANRPETIQELNKVDGIINGYADIVRGRGGEESARAAKIIRNLGLPENPNA